MAATNFTPIILYHTTTASAAPTAGNLNNGELAINITDGKLFYKDNGGTVQVIATKGTGTIGGSNTQVQYNSSGALAGSANFTFNGTTATINTLNLTNALGTAYGGTALTTYTQGDLVYASAANTLAKLGIGANTYILTSTGSVPQWSAPSSVTVSTATNLAGGAAGSVPYQSGAGVTTFLSIGTANQVLTSSGTAPQWSSLSSLGVTSLSFGTTGLTPSTATQGAITVAGTLATTNGGTGLTSFSANQVFYASSTSAVAQSVNLQFSGTDLTVYGITVGRGAGAVATNTAVGASALASGSQTGTKNTAVGQNSLIANTSGSNNVSIGTDSLPANTTGGSNVSAGVGAMYANTTGSSNTAYGHNALQANTTASNNTAVGYQAGYSNTTGTRLTAVGWSAGRLSTGDYNTFIGSYSGYGHTSGSFNTAVGDYAMGVSTITGIKNTAIGQAAMSSLTSGANNTALGVNTLTSTANGSNNTALGMESLYSSNSNNNTAVGYRSLYTISAGQEATAVGASSLYNATGDGNTAVGYYASNAVSSGTYNTTLGRYAGGAQTASTGSYNVSIGNGAASYMTSGSSNVYIGYQTGLINTTGANNVGVGREALTSNTTASNNTAVGYQAAYANTTGTGNVALGAQTLYTNSTGIQNTAIGENALYTNTANNNTAVGYYALRLNTTGSANTAIGVGASQRITTGSNNTSLGYLAFNQLTTGSNSVAIGADALNNTTTASSNTAVGYQAGYSTTTGYEGVHLGARAGYSQTDARGNVFIGRDTGYSTTGGFNTFVGFISGNAVTTGTKNTIIGAYSGNQGGLDIRTASNYIVLSDGDGNPRLFIDNAPKVIGTSPQVFSTLQDANAFQAAYRTGYYSTGTTSKRYMPGFGIVGQSNDGYVQHTVIGQVRSASWGDTYIAVGGNDSYPTAAVYFGLGGTVGLNTETPNSGTGITFPATQNASSDANTLDDYEEGTWTPTLIGASSTSGQSYTHQRGRYTKIGNLVTATFDVQLSDRGTLSGTAQIDGLPFSSTTSPFNYKGLASIGYWASLNTNYVFVSLTAPDGNSSLIIRANTAASANILDPVATDFFTNNTRLIGGVTYMVS